ncbi:DUF6493 family protein [Paeniglutamicibacter sp. NPDC091659]|uniref:DUF6493 family protein n=1 Tax=Paeniglutamicibacter sp. NPDC091659 TaxID=3364389 RepID=UPI0037FA0B0E
MSNEAYHFWEFNRDLTALVDDTSATLETLNERMLKINDPDLQQSAADPRFLTFLADTEAQWPSFVALRLGEIFHGVQREHDDDYVLDTIAGLGRWTGNAVRSFMLTHDVGLREDVFWRFFEVEGGGETSLANIDKFNGENGSWKDTVVGLVNDGVLERERVLLSCLQALNRDFSSYRAGWFSRLYDVLDPSALETAAHQSEILHLLSSNIPATVSLAVRQIALLHRSGNLDTSRFVGLCSPALASSKASALKILDILGTLASANPSTLVGDLTSRAELFSAIACALTHPHRDAQRAAAELLVMHQQTALLEVGFDSLAPATATAFSAIGSDTPIFPVPATPIDPLVLSPSALPVQSWENDEVLERFAALLENDTDQIDFELGLAWLAANDAPATLQPLARRAAKIDAPDYRNDNFSVDLILAATNPAYVFRPGRRRNQRFGAPETRPNHWPEEESVIPAFHKRMREVVEILQGRAPRRLLLATPTDAHGWIDPVTLVERLLISDAEGHEPLHFDTIVALLRTGPERRADALNLMSKSHISPACAEAANALAYALGGPALEIKNSPWRVAAARARAPLSSDENLRLAGLTILGQTDPATVNTTWIERRVTYGYGEDTSHYKVWDLTLQAAVPTVSLPDYPTVIPSCPRDTGDASPQDIRQLALSVPFCTLPLVAATLSRMNSAVDYFDSAAQEAILYALETHPGIWHQETGELLGLALSAHRGEVRIRAAEIFAAAIPDRLSAAELARGMKNCAGPAKASRWASSLSDVASISQRAARSVVETLTELFPLLDRRHHGIGTLMNVLLDESIRLGKAPESGALIEWLAGFTGSTAAARTARQLLAL